MATYEWFTSADARVCATCRGLDGTQWSDLDPNKAIPIPAHTGCRCRIIETGTAEYDRAVIGRELRRQIDADPNRHRAPWQSKEY